MAKRFALIPIAAAVMALGVAGPSAAATETFSFGDLLPGQSGPDDSSTWASLSVTTITPTSYLFTLTLSTTTFTSLFGSSAFVSQAIFNTQSGLDPLSASITGTGNGVSNVKLITNAPTLGLGFDFGDCFGSNANCAHGGAPGRLQAGEHVSWTTSFAAAQGDPLLFGSPPIGLHVQAFSSSNSSSAWYGVTSPIPEPETYAMLLAGLGLLGFAARRRKLKETRAA